MFIKKDEAICGILLKYTDKIIFKRAITMGLLFLLKFGGEKYFFATQFPHKLYRKYVVILFECSQKKNTIKALS